MIRTWSQFLRAHPAAGFSETHNRVAVGAVLFAESQRLLMIKRGPEARDGAGKLEGVGGRACTDGDLVDELRREIAEELGPDVVVEVDDLLYAQNVRFQNRRGWSEDWIVLSYVARLVRGTPRCHEPHKIAALHWLTLDEWLALPEHLVSKSVTGERRAYLKWKRQAKGRALFDRFYPTPR